MDTTFNIKSSAADEQPMSLNARLVNSMRALEPDKFFDVPFDQKTKGTRYSQIKQASLHSGIPVKTKSVSTDDGDVIRVSLRPENNLKK